MTALTIQSEECAFTLPIDSMGWRQIHKNVHELINSHAHPAARDWVFSVTPMPPDNRLAIVTARGPELAGHLEKQPAKLNVNVADQLRVECTLACSRRHRNDNGRDVERPVPATDVAEFAAEVLGRNGMSAEGVELKGYQKRWIDHPRGEFFIIEGRVVADVQITDTAAFAKAYLHGVGRKKTYGFGMIEVIDDSQ